MNNAVKDKIDVTLLVTFHREGLYAHSTLNCIERCRLHAEKCGIRTEYVWVLDCVDTETKNVLFSHPTYSSGIVNIVEVEHADSGASRNSGIIAASGEAIAILDGDDYYSTNWIAEAWNFILQEGDRAILHPEMIINFGIHSVYGWQIDQLGQYFDALALLHGNLWASWTFAKKSLYVDNPYVTTRPELTGFGYEDWHWNCEAVANGLVHRVVPKTIGFYRRKSSASLLLNTVSSGGIMPPTRLFDVDVIRGGNE